MSISANLVKELRERTGAGMMECKKALVETDGNIEVAIENMRKSGEIKAAKRATKMATEGVVVIQIADDRRSAAIAEINCETDFVARDEYFKNFADEVAKQILLQKVKSAANLESTFLKSGSETVEQSRQALVTKMGENIQIRRFVLLESRGIISGYVHSNGKIGVLVEMESGNEILGKDLAMHVAASHPWVVQPKDVPQHLVDKEKEIYLAQAKESGKPPEVIEKIVQGRVNKFLSEVSLVGQSYVKDSSFVVGQLLKNANATVLSFIRYAVGEGITGTVSETAQGRGDGH